MVRQVTTNQVHLSGSLSALNLVIACVHAVWGESAVGLPRQGLLHLAAGEVLRQKNKIPKKYTACVRVCVCVCSCTRGAARQRCWGPRGSSFVCELCICSAAGSLLCCNGAVMCRGPHLHAAPARSRVPARVVQRVTVWGGVLALGGMNGRQDHVEFDLFGRIWGIFWWGVMVHDQVDFCAVCEALGTCSEMGGMNGRQDHVEFELFGRYLRNLMVGSYGARSGGFLCSLRSTWDLLWVG
jgi:hypothetical protein